jgi:hypothetical protein
LGSNQKNNDTIIGRGNLPLHGYKIQFHRDIAGIYYSTSYDE